MSAPSRDMSADDDGDVEITGATGFDALRDAPHARCHCLVHPIKAASGSNTSSCAFCVCFVCEQKPSACKAWTAHCNAVDSDPTWIAARHKCLRRNQAEANAPSAPRGPPAGPAYVPPVMPPGMTPAQLAQAMAMSAAMAAAQNAQLAAQALAKQAAREAEHEQDEHDEVTEEVTPPPPPDTQTHTHAHTNTDARTHTHTHAHAHTHAHTHLPRHGIKTRRYPSPPTRGLFQRCRLRLWSMLASALKRTTLTAAAATAWGKGREAAP
ncbi:hypothetical protein T492DRAFT_831570 [Pavlovales sp. CCMP2436]|nr:hypothetical protein T492DRAFT_831570 [Pavlovales sp. CCMP2436]